VLPVLRQINLHVSLCLQKRGEGGKKDKRAKNTGGKRRVASAGAVVKHFCPLRVVVQGGASCCIDCSSQIGGKTKCP